MQGDSENIPFDDNVFDVAMVLLESGIFPIR